MYKCIKQHVLNEFKFINKSIDVPLSSLIGRRLDLTERGLEMGKWIGCFLHLSFPLHNFQFLLLVMPVKDLPQITSNCHLQCIHFIYLVIDTVWTWPYMWTHSNLRLKRAKYFVKNLQRFYTRAYFLGKVHTMSKQNTICIKIHLEVIFTSRSLFLTVVGRIRGGAGQWKVDKTRREAKCSVGHTKLPTPLPPALYRLWPIRD